MRGFRLFVVCACLALPAAGCAKPAGEAGGGLRVYAAFYALADFAGQAAGGPVGVIVPTDADPHDWEPTARDMAALEAADVIIYGAGMTPFIDDLREIAVNAAFADVTEGLPTGDDPHVWLNPLYAKQIVANIADALAQADPANAEAYRANYDLAAGKLDELAEAYTSLTFYSYRAHQEIIVDHAAYGHLCDYLYIEQVALSGTEDDAEPTPAQMARVIDLIKEHKHKLLFAEPGRTGAIDEIARETGAEVVVLDPFERAANADDDYYAVMRRNLEAIKRWRMGV